MEVTFKTRDKDNQLYKLVQLSLPSKILSFPHVIRAWILSGCLLFFDLTTIAFDIKGVEEENLCDKDTPVLKVKGEI